MKTFILSFLVNSLVLYANAQVTLEHTYPNGYNNIQITKLSQSGVKLVELDRAGSKLNLYNLNHSLFKSILIPFQDSADAEYKFMNLYFVTDELFNTDDKIEYMICFTGAPNKPVYTKIYNQDGNLLLHERGYNYVNYAYGPTIYNTDSGAKLMLFRMPNGPDAKVYNLGGKLLQMKVQQIQLTNKEDEMFAYPNPARGNIHIEYLLPDGVRTGTLLIYNPNGELISKYEVTNAFKNILIETPNSSGIYFYQLKVNGDIIATKKFILE